MSTAFVKQSIEAFLINPAPEVLCIEGRWGTGKTFAWNNAVEEAAQQRRIIPERYAYVSLFGLKDSDDIIQSIYVNADVPPTREAAAKSSPSLFGYSTKDVKKEFKKLTSFATEHANVPYIAGLGGAVRAIMANAVKDTVVCIDDFERRGKDVSINDVMGTIVQLRDARDCKVVLIFNENSLNEEDKKTFRRLAEKVFNRIIRFAPTPAESTAIVFTGNDPLSRDLSEACVQLGIVNIRVIAKIRQFAMDLHKLLVDIDPDVAKDVMRSLVVIVWSIVSPEGEGAPPLKYLLEKRSAFGLGAEKTKSTPEEDRWKVLLTEYGFSHVDDFDRVLIADVENGFFNAQALKPHIEAYLKNATSRKAQAALERAWRLYHDSFDDNAEAVAAQLFAGCMENLQYLTPLNLNSAIVLLKDLNQMDKAASLLKKYMEVRGDEDIFELRESAFGGEVRDPEVKAAFAEKAAMQPAKAPTALEAATRIYKGGWSAADEMVLAGLSIEDFVVLFKSLKGTDRSILIYGALTPRKISNATDRQKQFATKAEAALIQIGSESLLNAHRLKAFQVEMPAAGNDVDA